MKKIVAIVLGVVMMGCTAGLAYSDRTKGTECLNNSDPDGAIVHFTKACETCSYDWNNFNGLAAAYCMKGDLENAWKYSHKACYINPGDYAVQATYMSIYQNFVKGKTPIGSTQEEIIANLGEPDKREPNKLTYGIVIFYFIENKLVKISTK